MKNGERIKNELNHKEISNTKNNATYEEDI